MSIQGYWADLPSSVFADLPPDCVAVLPVDATEPHGPHLPLSVDSDLIDAVVSRMLCELASDQSVRVLPTLTVTKSDAHADFPGTLTYGAETLLVMLRDMGASVARAGVSRLVLFNAQGGNTALLQVAARNFAAFVSDFARFDHRGKAPQHRPDARGWRRSGRGHGGAAAGQGAVDRRRPA